MSGPTPAQLRQHAAALLEEARAGAVRATIAELSRRVGVTRPTLYRNHPDIVAEFDQAAKAMQQREPEPRPRTPTQRLVERIAKLRQENENLRLHVELYEEHIRRLTMENGRMGRQLADLSNVTVLDHRRQRGQR